jgi:hypothetical protein
MDNFNLRKYLAEGKLLKEEFVKGTPQYYVKYTTLDGKEVKSELMSKREAIYKERDLVDSDIKKSSVHKIQKNMDLNGKEYEIEYELDKDIEYRTDEKGKPIAENKLLKEDMNPIWVIDAFEDSADIEQAGPAYKESVIDIIKSKHPNISDKDLEASIEVMNVTWYNEARSNAKGSEPEEMKVSAEDFADGAIEHYEDVIMFDNNNRDSNIDDDFDKRLNALIKDSRHPTKNLKYFSERHRNKFRNYAEKFLKPINASDSQIRSALFKYATEYYDTKDI